MTVERRLTRLKKEYRWTERAGAAFLIGSVCTLLVAGSESQNESAVRDEVRARRFVVVAPDGTQRGILSASSAEAKLVLQAGDSNHVELRAYDLTSVTPWVEFGPRSAAELHLRSPDSAVSITAGWNNTTISVRRKQSGRSATFQILDDGTAQVTLRDKDGKLLFNASR